MLVAHIARTANVCATDPGLPVSEVQRTLGVNPVSDTGSDAEMQRQWCNATDTVQQGQLSGCLLLFLSLFLLRIKSYAS